MWTTSGSAETTLLLKELNEGSAGSFPRRACVTDKGLFYFSATSALSGEELWVSNGTDAGTLLVADIHAGAGDSAPRPIGQFDNILLFSADNGIDGTELWMTVLPANLVTSVVGEHAWSNSFALFPNPVGARFTVEAVQNVTTESVVTIFDIDGRRIAAYNWRMAEPLQIESLHWQPGIYVVIVSTKAGDWYSRIIR
ncbi:MAG: T9SS type A sorting domain-containing protein [Bacteroidia bacterium]|nr:T9SS type A sorting domain-containing protein [Bacteroidia bacterium]